MSKVRVAAFTLSIDGYGAGVHQDLENPMGVRGGELHRWFRPTATFKKMSGQSSETSGTTGVDNDVAAHSFENVGAWILGRNMFGPVRGPWPNDDWKGWWGEEPPYHTPVFVLTHHARAPLEMKGGTTFHFVTEGADAALDRAQEAANGNDVRVGGGVATVRHYLLTKKIDAMHLAISPVLLGQGESLFHGIDLHGLGYKVVLTLAGANATHVFVEKKSAGG